MLKKNETDQYLLECRMKSICNSSCLYSMLFDRSRIHTSNNVNDNGISSDLLGHLTIFRFLLYSHSTGYFP